MAAKKEMEKHNGRWMELPRKLGLAYLGAFGLAGDQAVKLFNLFVKRGERVEKDMRKFVQEVQKEQPGFVANIEKPVKKTVKKVEAAV